ncbi:hypothetical protein RSOLAG22IIIB_13472 [Rhizoctonia solani]|uniref:Uncharacterized protein n=1 Tax=Rhizoctonia solani TaxID=456999 RepID=A0A0K6FNM8_9AGAM|nr:unnamed protein product [Rhizoctonia solani]CUA67594.1 hypothetical protein RSOLAG22IIIB_13472 [Rhizoctonia solani]
MQPPQAGVNAASGIDRLTLRQDKTAEGFRSAPSVSAAAYHPVFKQQQEHGYVPIHNGRPYELTEIPIQLFHPAFDFFTNQLKSDDEIIANEYSAVERFMFGSQALYNTKADRWIAIRDFLMTAIGHPMFGDFVYRDLSDGVVVFTERNSALRVHGVIVELENEIGTGNSDPGIRAA